MGEQSLCKAKVEGSSPSDSTMSKIWSNKNERTLVELERSLANLEHWIDNWKHPTIWEAANHRMLKRTKIRRNEVEVAIRKLKDRKKELRYEEVRKTETD